MWIRKILIGLSSSLLTFALILQTHRLEIYCIIYIYEYIDQVDYLSWQILIGLSHSPNLCTYLANRLEMSQNVLGKISSTSYEL